MTEAKILIVEDDAIIYMEILSCLESFGYDVVASAQTGLEAVANTEKYRPEIILMDIKLKGEMDGIDTAEIIYSRFNIPIIFLTAFAEERQLERAKLTLPFGYLVKPVQGRDLNIAIEMALYAAEIKSEQKLAEKALLESEKKYRTLVENLPDFISRYDKKGHYVYVSPNTIELSGRKAEDCIGKTHNELGYPEEQTHPWDIQIRELFDTGEPQELDFFFESVESLRYLNWRLIPEFDDEGNIEYACGITRDITEREQAKVQAQQQLEFLYQVINSFSHPFYVINVDSYEIELANKASESHRTVNESVKCYELLHQMSKPCDKANHPCPLEQVRRMQGPVVIEQVHIDKNDKQKCYEIHAYPIFNEDGDVAQMIEYVLDITDKKRKERESRELERQLKQMQKMEALGTLASGIVHDFNNILHPILGYASMGLQRTKEADPLHEYFDSILTSSNRAKELVKQILTFSRYAEQELRPLKLQPIIKEVLQLIRSSIPSTIQIESDIDDDCSMVLADVTKIHQIVMNIAINAFHAMKDTGGALKVSLKPVEMTMDTKAYVCLCVSDTGEGMSSDTQQRIFDPYFTTKEKGTGLGLSVVLGIVKSLGGYFKVTSTIGSGTDFNVYLPLTFEKNAETADPKTQIPKGDNEHILFIDDEVPVVKIAEEILERLGYTVTSRTSSDDALEVFKSQPEDFDLIITDMRMPVLTGLQLAERLLEIRSDIPIILSTGFNEKVDQQKANRLGIREILLKPVTFDQFAVAIHKTLANSLY